MVGRESIFEIPDIRQAIPSIVVSGGEDSESLSTDIPQTEFFIPMPELYTSDGFWSSPEYFDIAPELAELDFMSQALSRTVVLISKLKGLTPEDLQNGLPFNTPKGIYEYLRGGVETATLINIYNVLGISQDPILATLFWRAAFQHGQMSEITNSGIEHDTLNVDFSPFPFYQALAFGDNKPFWDKVGTFLESGNTYDRVSLPQLKEMPFGDYVKWLRSDSTMLRRVHSHGLAALSTPQSTTSAIQNGRLKNLQLSTATNLAASLGIDTNPLLFSLYTRKLLEANGVNFQTGQLPIKPLRRK